MEKSRSISKDRRARLRFASIEELRQHLAGLADADGVDVSGKWTTGQILFHLAAAFESSSHPSPRDAPRPTRLMKLPLRMVVLRRGLPRGVSIPSAVADRLTPPPDALHDEQYKRLLHSIEAFESATGDLPIHPVLGVLTRNEWRQFHLRHCELHLGHIIHRSRS